MNHPNDIEQFAITHPMNSVISVIEKKILNQELSDPSIRLIADVGAGDGRYEKFIKERFGKEIWAVEPSQIRCNRLAEQNIPFMQAHAECLPFFDSTVDCVLMMQVLEHLQNPEAGLIEARRVLKFDGKLIAVMPNYPFKRLYDWRDNIRYLGKWNLPKDTPTHISRFGLFKFWWLLNKYFNKVKIIPSYVLGESKFSFVRHFKLFAHKLIGVCEK